jgi:hypothetical protein
VSSVTHPLPLVLSFAQLEVLQRKEAIEAQHEDVKRRIEAERSLRDSEAPSISAAHGQRRDLEAQRNERSARLEDLRSSTKGTKEELIALRDDVLAQLARVAEGRGSAEATRAMIIASPEKIKAELVSLETAAEAEQSALDSAELRRRLIGRQLEVIAKAEKDVTKAMTLMSEAEVRSAALPFPSATIFLTTSRAPSPPVAGGGSQAQAHSEG